MQIKKTASKATGALRNTFNTLIGRNGFPAAFAAGATVIAEVAIAGCTYGAATTGSGADIMFAGLLTGAAINSAVASHRAANAERAKASQTPQL